MHFAGQLLAASETGISLGHLIPECDLVLRIWLLLKIGNPIGQGLIVEFSKYFPSCGCAFNLNWCKRATWSGVDNQFIRIFMSCHPHIKQSKIWSKHVRWPVRSNADLLQD